ncbi:MAG TPA: hypothetical protein VLO11_10515 [Luteolibacter sp.]|nr:hypothetical protein [Luteolibacter sp.]
MTKDASEIEVEVVEVENTLPAARSEPAREETPGGEWREWRQWQGRVRRIDTRWWPLWVIPGIIVLGLAAVAGAMIGLVVLVFVLIRALIRMLLR